MADTEDSAATVITRRVLLTGGTSGLGLDTRDETSVSAAVQAAAGRLGGIDLLVNNAGMGMHPVNPRFITEPQGFWPVSPAGFRAVIDTKLTGYFLVAREVTPIVWLASAAAEGTTNERIVATEFDGWLRQRALPL